jgi:hypothetical protein
MDNPDPPADLPQFNKDGKAFSDKAEEVFGASYLRLQQLERNYNPNMLFNKWFFITPAVAEPSIL